MAISTTYTSWSPTDKAAGITLTLDNTVTTNSNNAVCNARTVNSQAAGKFYWEVVYNTVSSIHDAAGITRGTASLTTLIQNYTSGAGACALEQSGNVYLDGISIGSFGSVSAGVTVCYALDLGAHLIWFRQGAAGNWNAGGTANPATGVGGLSVPFAGGAVPVFPTIFTVNTNDKYTADFGDTAFVGAVPSGFTSGWTIAAGGGAAGGTAQARAMVLA